ncbi:MAG: hypothetical protein ABL864_08990 [Terricaulis sp.]
MALRVTFCSSGILVKLNDPAVASKARIEEIEGELLYACARYERGSCEREEVSFLKHRFLK